MDVTARAHIREEFRLGHRFRFGKNWQRFLRTVDERSIQESEQRLKDFLQVDSLNNETFLDVGSGSGLHSLAARRLGANVVSFDYDRDSVDATRHLRDRFGFDATTWKVETGSVLDREYVASLGQFDVVYSWGVLHHTGAMWQALKNVQALVKAGGKLYIAIYNDSGVVSEWWLKRKQRYCSLPPILRPPYFLWVWAPIEIKQMGLSMRIDKYPKKIAKYVRRWKEYKSNRGMTKLYDMVDWIGGYPYEYAKADDLVAFYERAGFELTRLERNHGTGNHELVLVKRSNP